MANFNSLFANQGGAVKKERTQTVKITYIHYDKLIRNSHQYCDAGKEELENLADVIAASGKVLQPLLVRKVDADLYEIIAGHKRHGAAVILAESRGMEKYAMLPCIVSNSDDVSTRFAVVSSNVHHTKTPYEILHEIEEMRELLTTYPEAFPDLKGGRMVERLAEQLHMARSTVSEYRSIANNLGEKGMEALKDGKLEKSAAVALASLPENAQEKLIDEGKFKHKEIQAYKKERAEKEENSRIKQTPQTSPETVFKEETEYNTFVRDNICIHQPVFKCSLKKEEQMITGDGSGCSNKCCWACTERDGCEFRCESSQNRRMGDGDGEGAVLENREEKSGHTGENIVAGDIFPNQKLDEETVVRYFLEEQKTLLNEYLEKDDVTEIMIQRQKIIVDGLELLAERVEDGREGVPKSGT